MEIRTNPLARLSLRAFPAVLPAVAACVFFLDEPVALAIDGLLRSRPLLEVYARGIPDILLPFVAVTTAAMWTAWMLRVRRGIRDDLTRFFRLGGTVLPAAFLAKAALKTLFGRIETRAWLKGPAAPDLLWFRSGDDYGGFPSGHMTVFAALAAACWIHFPRGRPSFLAALLLLGAALVATNHHFLGDVISGGYLGLSVAAAAFAAMEGRLE